MSQASLSRIRLRFFTVFGVVALALWAAIGLALQAAEREAMERARADGRNLARGLAEYVSSAVRTIDLSLLHLRESWSERPSSFAEHVARHQKDLKHEFFGQVTVVKPDGRVAFSYLPDPQRVDLSDRQYFKVHNEGSADELYISEPFRGRLSGKWIIQFTRAIYARQGKFAGVLVMTVPPPALERIYQDIELGNGAAIVLVRQDGQILAHSRDLATAATVSLAGVPELTRDDTSGAEARRKAKIDGIERLYRYQKVPGYPLTIIVGQSVEGILAGYRAQRATYLASGLFLTALLLAVTLLLVSRRHDKEAADRSRARFEAELRRSEEHLRSLFDSFPIAVAHIDKTQRITFANRIYRAEYGADPDGRLVREFVGEDVYAVLQPNIERALAGEEVQFERSFIDEHGETRTRSLRYIPDRAASGEVVGFFGLREDITERKRHETELRRFRAAMDAVADAIYLIDRASMRFIDVNAAACRSHGRTREELLSLGPHRLLSIPREKLERAYDAVIAGDASAQRYELLRPARDGRPIWLEVQRSAQRAERGWMIVVVIRDVTQRKRLEEAMRQSEERLKLALRCAPITIFSQDQDLRYSWIHNLQVNLSAADIVGKTDADFVSAAHAAHLTAIKRRALGGVSVREELSATIAGRTYSYDLVVDPVRDESGRIVGITGASWDITELKRAEEKIRKLNEELEQRVRERTAELRAAVSALQAEVEERRLAETSALDLASRLQTMARRLGQAQEVERRRLAAELHDGVCSNLAAVGLNLVLLQKQLLLGEASDTAQRLSGLIALIDEAKANAKDISVDLRPLLLDDRDLLSALEEYARKFEGSTGITVEVKGADSGRRLPAEEKIALFRITQEALTNCARHAHAKAVAIELNTGADHLVLCIADDGVGIDLAGGNGEKHGLGLISMQERAEAIGGKWRIESAPGKGTRVVVRVDAAAVIEGAVSKSPRRPPLRAA